MNYKIASFTRRLVAYWLDNMLIFALILSIAWKLGFDEVFTYRTSSAYHTEFMYWKIYIKNITFLTYCIYSCILEATPLKGTLGKYIFNIKVIKKNGEKLTLMDSIKRNLFKIISKIPLSLGFIWALFNKDRYTWHDKIANTVVVKGDD